MLVDSCTWECEKCGDYCNIDGVGLKSYAWCYTCNDYAQGFDGSAWWYERAAGMADNLRKREREGNDGRSGAQDGTDGAAGAAGQPVADGAPRT